MNWNKRHLFLLPIIIIILLTVALAKEKLLKPEKISQVCFKNNCFNVELAITQADRAKGLMFRKSLEKNEGMLFVFESERNYPFWMKNTLIPLDMIWMNQHKEVVFIEKNALPCSEIDCPLANPEKKAKYVLEINGGISDATDIKIGDIANFSF